MHTDSASSNETKAVVSTSTGLDSVRAQAHRQRMVKLQRTTGPSDGLPRNSYNHIKTLKNKSTDEPPPSDEPGVIESWWGWFQEFLGNR